MVKGLAPPPVPEPEACRTSCRGPGDGGGGGGGVDSSSLGQRDWVEVLSRGAKGHREPVSFQPEPPAPEGHRAQAFSPEGGRWMGLSVCPSRPSPSRDPWPCGCCRP